MAGWYHGLGAAAVCVVAVAIGVPMLRHRIVVVTVTGQSMQPTLIPGDRVLVRRGDMRELRPGQIVVFQRPSRDRTWQTEPQRMIKGRREWAIKRLIAIPGDPLPAEMLAAASDNPDLLVQGLLVPRRKLLVMGDNADGSFDSRHFGYVPAEQLLGVVRRKLRLPRRARTRHSPADLGPLNGHLKTCARAHGPRVLAVQEPGRGRGVMELCARAPRGCASGAAARDWSAGCDNQPVIGGWLSQPCGRKTRGQLRRCGNRIAGSGTPRPSLRHGLQARSRRATGLATPASRAADRLAAGG